MSSYLGCKMKPFLKSKQYSTDRGANLVELMIAIGILAAASVLVTSFLRQSQDGDLRFEARSSANKFNQDMIRRVEMAFNFRAITGTDRSSGFSIQNNGLRLRIVQEREDNPSLTYQVVFTSRCRQIPADLASGSDLARAIFRAESGHSRVGSCLDLLDCQRGSFPQIVMRYEGGNAPDVAEQVFPTEASLYSQRNPIGHCIRYETSNSPSGVVVHIDSVSIDERNTNNLIQVVSQDRILRLRNTSNVRILP